MPVPHPGQRERGATTDSPRGTRWATTVRKLPKASPQTKTMRSAGAISAAADRGRSFHLDPGPEARVVVHQRDGVTAGFAVDAERQAEPVAFFERVGAVEEHRHLDLKPFPRPLAGAGAPAPAFGAGLLVQEVGIFGFAGGFGAVEEINAESARVAGFVDRPRL